MKKLASYFIAAAVGFGAAALYFGDCDYKIKNVEDKHYLCNKKTKQCEVITDDFQLGSLEYRIEGIKKEMVENERILKQIQK